ncbi:MAG: hypothetical protein EZS28_018399 [Streblomastix strix]|uniref:Uncharacterized protein n=1 Tax=Streblomastix strix TaxID=222440 RepID=A0A5J4VTS3_9EUKA|nr:MAG: hypothetical protein EZS28_018399 [Streblomastix strix]
MTFCNEKGKVYGSLYDVRMQYLEKVKRRKNRNIFGGEESNIYDHRYEFITAIIKEQLGNKNQIIQEFKLNKPTNIVEQVQKLFVSAGKEFSAVKLFHCVVSLKNRLSDLLILHCFRNDLHTWMEEKGISGVQEDGSILLPQFQPAFDLIQPFGVSEKFNRLFLHYLKFLQDGGYVKIKPHPGFDDTKIDQQKIFNQIPTSLIQNKKDEWMKAISSNNPYELASFILQHWPQARSSVVLIIDVGLRIGEVLNSESEGIQLIHSNKVPADVVYRDDIETRPYNTVIYGILQMIYLVEIL